MSDSDNGLRADSPAAAREQAAEAVGFLASKTIVGKNGETFEIPSKWMLDPDAEDRYQQLLFDVDASYDRGPDVKIRDGDGDVVDTIRGPVLEPHRIKGKRLEPWNFRLMKAIFGEDYQRARDAGIWPSQVAAEWIAMDQRFAERRRDDSKSDSGDTTDQVVSGRD
jgi:hypothetical protein